jgi:hypothetical protein
MTVRSSCGLSPPATRIWPQNIRREKHESGFAIVYADRLDDALSPDRCRIGCAITATKRILGGPCSPDEGYLSGYLAVALVQGKVKAIEGQSINMPNIGTRIFGINGTIITGPPVVFTKENIGNYHF